MKPRFVLRVEFARYVVAFYRFPPKGYGTVFVISTRKWLNPGVFLWRVTLQRTGKDYRVWKSAWRRPRPRLGGPELYGPFEKVR